ncbi:unnamed protein product [Fraxinus pennsylvanica]|uniref:Gnk2-homologous domain-containing protein n=1 Tax=Fraxinus pennsylvanica TaxID=56036 RepID=A0AAD1ZQ19_9LAMI|nr:unnamed protein product [Fraxinus pennsylvanica]
MNFWKWLFPFIFLTLTNFVVIVDSLYPSPYFLYQCLNNGNYTTNSTYHTNLNGLLSSVSSNIDRNGFYYSTAGQYSNRVNAIALCRGDVQLDKCRSCVYYAALFLSQLCPYQKQAILSDLHCMVRYSNDSIFRTLAIRPYFQEREAESVMSTDQFNQDLRTLFDSLRSRAAYGGPLKKFAAANRTAPAFQTIYGLVQCTPDLTSQDCSNCLLQAAKLMSECCNGAKGVKIHTPSCCLRYRTNPFYNNSMVEEPPRMIPKPPAGKNANTTRTIIIIIVPIVLGLILVICVGIFLRMRQKRKQEEKLGTDNEKCSQYDFGTIRAATDNFSDANKLGQGGFGIVYKGELPNGKEIAVKRIGGTPGYMAPEYAMHGHFSVKSAVFSFGVLVLEIITGQKINSSYHNGNPIRSLLNFAWKNWHERTTTNIIDPALRAASSSLQDIVRSLRCLQISLLCVQENAADRPTMAMLVLMLSNFSLTLPAPSQPAFYESSSHISSSTIYHTNDAL